MKLTQIIIHGFKSFADKTVFDIHAGVTCVVGPNGCGKSNVVESVRWVLGEQSVKQLRGTDRTDVIFQGSSSRKPLNMAEVSLTFDNKTRKLNYPSDEVTITRRLYRSGESQYLINRNQCLLRNIRELFLDTGVGTSSYSIIQQGRVKALLESNGKDRRHVFEEAAGIGKYMVHRGRTMRTLERIQNRLDAFRGILTDARKQYKLALKQAERTLEAEAIRKQLEGQQKVLYLIQYSDATEQLGLLGTELTQLEGDLKNSDERRAKLSEDESQTQRRRNESTQRSYQIKTQSIETEGQIARLTSEAITQQAMADSEEKLAIQTAQRADEMQKQSVEARMSSETARAELASAESERQPQAQTCAVYARDLAAARQEQETLAQAEETAAREQTRTQQELARTGAELGALRARIDFNRAKVEAAERERVEAAAALTRLEEQRAVQTAEIAARETERAEKLAALTALEAVCATLETQRSELLAELDVLGETIARTRARTGAAESFLAAQLQKSTSPEMVSEALTQVFTAAATAATAAAEAAAAQPAVAADPNAVEPAAAPVASAAAPVAPAVVGALVQFLKVEPAWAVSVEAALGDFAQAVVLRDSAAVLQAAQQPAAAGAQLVALTAPADEPTRGPSILSADASAFLLVGPATQVTCDESFRPLLDWLFGGVALTEKLTPEVITVARLTGVHTLVDKRGATWRGGLLQPAVSGVASAAGTSEADLASMGVLALRTELERLAGKSAELLARKTAQQQALSDVTGQLTTQRNEAENLRRAAAALGMQLNWQNQQRTALEKQIEAAERRQAEQREALARLTEMLAADEAQAALLTTRQAELTAAVEQLHTRLDELRAARHATAEQLHKLGAIYRDAQALLAKLEQICESRRTEAEAAERRAVRLEEETRFVRQSAESHREESVRSRERSETAKTKAAALVDEAAALKTQADELEQAVRELSTQLDQISGEKNSLEERLRQARDTFNTMQLDHQRVRMERDSILDKARTEFRVDLAEVLKKREAKVEELAAAATAAAAESANVEQPVEGAPNAEPAAGDGAAAAAGADRLPVVAAVNPAADPGADPAADGTPPVEGAAELAEAAAVEAAVVSDLADVAEEAGLVVAAPPVVEQHTVPTVPVEVDPFDAATLDLNLIPQIREKINKLRETLESFGEVNWNALQMKRETEVRVQFLEEQFTDLETARDRLRDILTTINRKSRELFLNCFNDVRARFNGMFRKLFGGGQAEIFLEQNVDVLEAGIEIVAKPPGKEPQHLTQLSGGEKTMTTIGLLMSIYQIKPSPFCIMDEIDADLDGPNVDRLNLTIKEFLDRSQFLIISHRPRTMTYADVLYGISMNMIGPEAGVSKRVSIAFEEIEEQYGKDDLPKEGEQAATSQAAG